MEPIQAEAGIIEPHNGFLKKLRERCDATGTLLVLDEIQTGFGRTGKLFAFEHYGIVPDIVCFAKSFGGGMPLGAFVSSGTLMQTLTHDPELGHITTFGGHPVSCAAGLAAQQFIEEQGLIAHANRMGELYRRLMDHEGISTIRGRGLFLAVEFNEKISGERLMKNIFENGIVLDQFLFCTMHSGLPPRLLSLKRRCMNHPPCCWMLSTGRGYKKLYYFSLLKMNFYFQKEPGLSSAKLKVVNYTCVCNTKLTESDMIRIFAHSNDAACFAHASIPREREVS